MKKLLFGLSTLIALYCLYWFGIAAIAPNQITQYWDELKAEGPHISHDPLKVKGFPLSFKSALKDVTITVPQEGFIGATAFGLNADHVDFKTPAFWPFSQTLTHSGASSMALDLTNSGQLSHVSTQTQMLRVKASGLKAKTLTAQGQGIAFTPQNAHASNEFALRSIGSLNAKTITNTLGGGSDMIVNFTVNDIGLDDALMAQLGRALGTTITYAAGDADISTRAVGNAPPQLTALDLRSLELNWGAARMKGIAALSRDALGLQGSVSLDIDDSAGLLSRLKEVGILSQQQYFTMNLMLGASKDVKTVKLSVKNNVLYMGPLRLIELPF